MSKEKIKEEIQKCAEQMTRKPEFVNAFNDKQPDKVLEFLVRMVYPAYSKEEISLIRMLAKQILYKKEK